MKILLAGATGFIGSKLALRLTADGHRVIALVRDETAARQVLAAEVELLRDGDQSALIEAMDSVDAVVNLAGSPVARRWTPRVRRAIRESRVDLADRLVEAMRRATACPRVLVSTSAVGIYDDAGSEVIDEDGRQGRDFLATVCRAWESAAMSAESLDVRVVTLRLGVVLGRDGGALAMMLPAFRFGLGATLGSGSQYFPWIAIDDLLEMFVRALTDPSWRGAVNATAPHPVRQRTFTDALAGAVGRRSLLRVPAPLLRLAFGGAAHAMLVSHRVVPRRALQLGFSFRHETIEGALRSALNSPGPFELRPASGAPIVEYLRRRPPQYVLQTQIELDAPLQEVFAFFENAANLGALTPANMSLRIVSDPWTAMRAGLQIRYRLELGADLGVARLRVPMRWLTLIDRYEKNTYFSDAQIRGPYACWYHEHMFVAKGERTVMIDRVWYALPLGPLGRLAHRWWVKGTLRDIFDHRASAIALRFGTDGSVAKHLHAV